MDRKLNQERFILLGALARILSTADRIERSSFIDDEMRRRLRSIRADTRTITEHLEANFKSGTHE